MKTRKLTRQLGWKKVKCINWGSSALSDYLSENSTGKYFYSDTLCSVFFEKESDAVWFTLITSTDNRDAVI